MARKTLYLVDASIYIFRAYFALPPEWVDGEGRPVHAVYGFAQFLAQLLSRVSADERSVHVALAFDESLTQCFRNRLYPPYKANRAEAPPDLAWQIQACRRLARGLGLAEFASKRYEADDLLGTLGRRAQAEGYAQVLVSRDKDLLQLLGAGDCLWDFAADKKIHYPDVAQHVGVEAEQICDWLALGGDSVDNIPGVPGIGHKTAVHLLRAFGSLDGVYARLHEVPGCGVRGARRVRNLLAEHRAQAYLSRRLATIHCQVPLRAGLEDLHWQGFDAARLRRRLRRLGFGDGLQARYASLAQQLA